jgi:hypothetical protein
MLRKDAPAGSSTADSFTKCREALPDHLYSYYVDLQVGGRLIAPCQARGEYQWLFGAVLGTLPLGTQAGMRRGRILDAPYWTSLVRLHLLSE